MSFNVEGVSICSVTCIDDNFLQLLFAVVLLVVFAEVPLIEPMVYTLAFRVCAVFSTCYFVWEHITMKGLPHLFL